MALHYWILCILNVCLLNGSVTAYTNVSCDEIICPETHGITLGAKDDGSCYLHFTKQVNYSVSDAHMKYKYIKRSNINFK